MIRASISASRMRSVGLASVGRHCSTSPKQTSQPRKQRATSDFVKRRRAYGQEMHKLRISFSSELAEAERHKREAKEVDLESLEGSAELRAARKREKSISRQAEHVARLEAAQEKKRERTEYKRRNWEEKRKQVMAERIAVADLLAEHAPEWVTEDTIDEHVERVVDEFFIVAAPLGRELMDTVELNDPNK